MTEQQVAQVLSQIAALQACDWVELVIRNTTDGRTATSRMPADRLLGDVRDLLADNARLRGRVYALSRLVGLRDRELHRVRQRVGGG